MKFGKNIVKMIDTKTMLPYPRFNMNKYEEIKNLCVEFLEINKQIEELNKQTDDKVNNITEVVKRFQKAFSSEKTS